MHVNDAGPADDSVPLDGDTEAADQSGYATSTLFLPPSRIKRLARLDKEVGTVTKDANFAITLATELFVGALAAEAAKVAKVMICKSVLRCKSFFDQCTFLSCSGV